MPSASSVKVSAQQQDKDKDLKNHIMDLTEPFKQVVTLVEHKIRNMEKRKGKLDSYKQEQEQGKELNTDQLAAVAKYGELMQSLEFARDLSKQVSQIQLETSRLLKKQQKKDQTERVLADLERTKQIMILTNWLHRSTTMPTVREDFVNGRNGAFALSDDEIEALDELSTITCIGMDKDKAEEDLGPATEYFNSLIDGKTKSIPNTSTTYCHMRETLLRMNACGYAYESDSETKIDTDENDISTDSKGVAFVGNDSAQIHTRQSPYNVVQDSQIDIESPGPDMDPAVVAVSTSAPPQLLTQQLATMKQVIPQSQHVSSQPEVKQPLENHMHVQGHGKGESTIDVYTGNSVTVNEVESSTPQMQQMQMQQPPCTVHDIGQMQEQQQEWIKEDSKYGNYGEQFSTNQISELIEMSDFMENNFSTWEGPNNASGDITNHRGGFRRGNSGGGNRGSRFQNSSNSNGFPGRGGGGGNRFTGSSGAGGMQWVASRSDRPGYEDYRSGPGGRHSGERDHLGDYKPRGGMSGPRGPPRTTTNSEVRGDNRNYFSGGPRNGAPPRGGTSGGIGRRQYRGGYGDQGPQQGVY